MTVPLAGLLPADLDEQQAGSATRRSSGSRLASVPTDQYRIESRVLRSHSCRPLT